MYVVNGIAYADEPSSGLRVVSARYVDNLRVVVRFSTGESRLLDLTDLAGYSAFEPLQDEGAARGLSVDHGILTWASLDIDIGAEAVYARSYEYEPVAPTS